MRVKATFRRVTVWNTAAANMAESVKKLRSLSEPVSNYVFIARID